MRRQRFQVFRGNYISRILRIKNLAMNFVGINFRRIAQNTQNSLNLPPVKITQKSLYSEHVLQQQQVPAIDRFDCRSEIWQRSLQHSFVLHGETVFTECRVYVVNMVYFIQQHYYEVKLTTLELHYIRIISFETWRKLFVHKMFRGTSCFKGEHI